MLHKTKFLNPSLVSLIEGHLFIDRPAQGVPSGAAMRNDFRNGAFRNRRHTIPVLVYILLTASGASSFASPINNDLAFQANTLGRVDDVSSGAVPLGFSVNYFGTTYTNAYVNNNGNITFSRPFGSFIPADLTGTSVTTPIIAPYWADVDTSIAGGVVTYGTGTVNGNAAFGVNWFDVDFWPSSSRNRNRNTFQLLLVSRPETGTGNFDIYYNYGSIQWDAGGYPPFGLGNPGGSGCAVAGYSAGTMAPRTSAQINGSLVCRSFIDGGPNALATNTNNGTPGQFYFAIRPLSNIDLAQPFYLASNLATTVFPVFQGGALRINASGTYTDNFTLSNSATNTINAYGNTATFSGVFSNETVDGKIVIADSVGGGKIIFSGANTYTGGTTVAGGTLVVTGTIGAVTVASGALQGTGTVGTTTVASGSTLSPGINGALGTLNVSGNLTMLAGSNYAVAVTPTAASKAIVSGSANVNGAVTATFAPGNYTVGQKFAIVESTGLVNGTFASLTHAGAALPFYLTDNLSYTSNSVYLNLVTKNLTPLLPTGSSSNLTNTAKAIDAFVTAGGIPNTGMLALYSQTGAALADSITQAEGQVGANVAIAVSQSFAPFLKTMTDQCASGPEQDASASCVWSSVYGGHAGISADVTTGAASLSGSNVGLAVGGQINIPEIDSVLAASMAIGQQSFSSGNGTGTSRDILLGIYAHKTIMDHGYASASLGYGNLHVTTTRTVTVAGTDVLSSNVTLNEFGGRVEGGYRFNVEDQFGMTPYLGVSLQYINTPPYAESVQRGTSSYTLSYLSQKNPFSYIEAGARLDRSFQLDDGLTLSAQGTIGWSHQLGYNPTSTVSFQSLIGSSFKLSGIKPANDIAVLGLNLQAQKATGLSFGVRLDSQVGAGTVILQGTGNFAYRW